MSISDPTPGRHGGINPEWVAGQNFIMVHLDLVDALDGSYAAAALLNRIVFRAGPDGWWTATRAEMAADTRLTEAVVKRALQELRDAGMIEGRRVSAFDPTLRWRPIFAGQPRDGGIRRHGEADSAVTVMAESAVTPSSKNGKNSPPPPEGEGLFGDPAPEPLRPVPVDALFDEWYARYPRKVGKGQARKAYAAALRKPGVTAQVLLDGLAAALPDLNAREAQYRPHPSSWLNGERWADDPAPVIPSGPRTDPFGDPTAPLPPPPKRDLYG